MRQLAGELTTEITMLSEVNVDLLAGDRGYRVIAVAVLLDHLKVGVPKTLLTG